MLIFNSQYVRPPSKRFQTNFLLLKLWWSKSQKSSLVRSRSWNGILVFWVSVVKGLKPTGAKKSRNTLKKKNCKRKFTQTNTVEKSFQPSTMVTRLHCNMEANGCQLQWSVSITLPNHPCSNTRSTEVSEKSLTPKWMPNSKKSTTKARVNSNSHSSSMSSKFLLQNHPIKKCRNQLCILIPNN